MQHVQLVQIHAFQIQIKGKWGLPKDCQHHFEVPFKWGHLQMYMSCNVISTTLWGTEKEWVDQGYLRDKRKPWTNYVCKLITTIPWPYLCNPWKWFNNHTDTYAQFTLIVVDTAYIQYLDDSLPCHLFNVSARAEPLQLVAHHHQWGVDHTHESLWEGSR